MTDFIIIGNMNAITYKEIFPYIKNNQLWVGYRSLGSEFYFNITDEYKREIVKEKKEGSGWKEINGIVCGRVANACWFTNLPVSRKPLILTKTYSADKYPKYDNYDAIEVSSVKDIPYDYDGVMGVPVSILDYNLDEVEIMSIMNGSKGEGMTNGDDGRAKFYVGEKGVYARILIKKKFEILGLDRYVEDNPNYGRRFHLNGKETYARILIRFEILGYEHNLDGNGANIGQFEINGKGVYKRILIRKKKEEEL